MDAMHVKDPIDRLGQLRSELEALKRRISGLETEIFSLREDQRTFRHPVEGLLSQRGLPVIAHSDYSRTFLPATLGPSKREIFYRLMRRYSFRLFLRDLIQFPENADLKTLTRYCSIRTVRSYLKSLAELGMVTIGDDRGYQLVSSQISSFGPTLEWYVSEVFKREFMAPALFNVRLHNTRFGGDYDVIALASGCLVYVEVKSSPPRGVELQAVSAFLNRLRDLQPHTAAFLVDTELRMKDKIVPLFEDALGSNGEQTGEYRVSRLVDEIFHINHYIYLVNSRKGIYSNLRTCFRDFLRAAQPAAGWTLNASTSECQPTVK
jgi:hypothetical protein